MEEELEIADGFVPTKPEEPDREPPPDIKLAMAVRPVSTSEETWRVVVYERGGSFCFRGSRTSLDWKTRRNAQKEADIYNRCWRGKDGDSFAVVKRVRVTVEEVPEEKA